jgi:hypothetical protein
LKDHGASREDINHDTRHMVHLREYQKPIGDFATRQREIDRRRALGEDVGTEQDTLDTEKKGFRGKLPEGKRKHFDELRLIRSHQQKRVELDGEQKASTLDSTQQDRVALNERLGVEKKVEEAKEVRAAEIESKPAPGDDIAARLGRRAQQAKQAEAPVSSTSKVAEQAAAETTAKPADKRQATNAKSFNPTV